MDDKGINKLYNRRSLEIMRTDEDALERGSNPAAEIKTNIIVRNNFIVLCNLPGHFSL